MFRLLTLAATSLLGLGAVSVCAGEVDARLDDVLRAAPAESVISALVELDTRADLAALTDELDAVRATRHERHEMVVRELQHRANATQPEFLRALEPLRRDGAITTVQAFWIANVVRLDGTPAALRAVADLPGVARVVANPRVESVAPVGAPVPAPGGPLAADDPEIGLEVINAPEAWDLGYTGSGILVAVIDSGVDGTHPALASRWAGLGPAYAGHPEWAFFDPYLGQHDFPYDDVGHGTHVTGSLCGGAPGDTIGVAPDVRWIAAAAIDRGGTVNETIGDLLESLQWVLDPDGDPGTSFDFPHVCNNSWGLADTHLVPDCDETFWSFLDALEAAGCVVVFAAGNEGSAGVRRPADRATNAYQTFSVAAIDAEEIGFPVANFSSRGPTECTPDGSEAIKPDISAPGVSVRSAQAGGGYLMLNGTSMATPHVSGVVALMRQANPDLTPEQLKEIIYQTASDLAVPGKDNDTGFGLINAELAVEFARDTVALTFTFPEGRLPYIEPTGGASFPVLVSGQGEQPAPGTAELHLSIDGGVYSTYPLVADAPNEYQAVFPAVPCGSVLSYYFTAETVGGETATLPFTAPNGAFTASGITGVLSAYATDFNADDGWTVTSENLLDGAWERAVPSGGGDRGDPPADFDSPTGDGACLVTDNEDGNSDVDGGPTTVTSPLFDASELVEPVLSYARWFTNDDLDQDAIVTELSNDDGQSWVLVETAGTEDSWTEVHYPIRDVLTPTSTMRVRFTVADVPNDSVTEAGVDAVRVTSYYCTPATVPGDVNGDGSVTFEDLVALLATWGPCPGCIADFDGSGAVDFADLLVLLSNFGA